MPWLYIGRTGPIDAATLDTDGALSVSSIQRSLGIGEVLTGLLARFQEPMFAVFDPNTGRIYATDDADHAEALGDALASPDYSILLRPDAGQTGRSLAWSVETNNGWPSKDSTVDSLIDAVKPKRSVESLLNKLVTNHLNLPIVAVLNQDTGRLELRRWNTSIEAVSEALAAVTPGGNAIGVQFTKPPGMGEFEWPVPT